MPTKRIFSLMLLLWGTSISLFAYPKSEEDLIKERIDSIQSQVVNPRYDRIVGSYLRTYTVNGRDKSERILGRRLVYFPIFEKYLKEYKLPEDLKYLPIVESALEPRAISVAGAGGLWQFMSETGRSYGLEINQQVDERCDPLRSTEAAMKHLSYLYNRFNDWELAIAAYNSGGGRVSRAMKRARSKNFWTIKRYLPRETANYVPAFIAATYLVQYYEEHGLEVRQPSLDAQLTETIQVQNPFTFYEIAQISGAPLEIIELLNPSYLHSKIPASPAKSRNLTLPRRHMVVFKAYQEANHPEADKKEAIATAPVFISASAKKTEESYLKQQYVLPAGKHLASIADQVNIPLLQIQAWNQLRDTVFAEEQLITVYIPQPLKENPMNFELKAFEPIRSKSLLGEHTLPIRRTTQPSIYEQELERFLYQREYLYYWTDKREKLSDIAEKIPGILLEDLLHLNDIKRDKVIRPDTKIKVKRLGDCMECD
jgi:membrane-bound lytic murein transglycosylase D